MREAWFLIVKYTFYNEKIFTCYLYFIHLQYVRVKWMIKKLYFIFIAFSFILVSGKPAYGQKQKVYFSEALTSHLQDYNKKVDLALAKHEDAHAKSLFDSLVKNHLQGSVLDPLYFNGYKTRISTTLDFDKPTLLLTYSAWCIPNAGEIPVLNKIAAYYKDLITIVVLFFDPLDTVRKKSRQFDRNIQVVYVDETTNKNMFTEKLLKQALGLPLCFVLSESGEILDISRRPPNKLDHSLQDQLAVNFTFLSRQIAAVHIDTNKELPEFKESFATWQ